MSPLRAPAVSVVMGIPSVRREVHSYLTDTLHSLISELSPQEKEDSVIVVLIAEASGLGPRDTRIKKQTERLGGGGAGEGDAAGWRDDNQNCSCKFHAQMDQDKKLKRKMHPCALLWRNWFPSTPACIFIGCFLR